MTRRILLAALLMPIAVAAHAPVDPPQDRYNSARRGASAAFDEALIKCRLLPVPARFECAKDARDRFAEEVASAKQALARERKLAQAFP